MSPTSFPKLGKPLAHQDPPIGTRSLRTGADYMQLESFRSWFKQSAVVDESGGPRVVYHGTNKRFDAFEVSPKGTYGSGIYFCDTVESAGCYVHEDKSALIHAVFLSIQNPWVVNADFESPGAFEEDLDCPIVEAILSLPNGRVLLDAAKSDAALRDFNFLDAQFTNVLKALAHDGIMSTYPDGSMEIIAFDPRQVKSIENTGSFDPKDPRFNR